MHEALHGLVIDWNHSMNIKQEAGEASYELCIGWTCHEPKLWMDGVGVISMWLLAVWYFSTSVIRPYMYVLSISSACPFHFGFAFLVIWNVVSCWPCPYKHTIKCFTFNFVPIIKMCPSIYLYYLPRYMLKVKN